MLGLAMVLSALLAISITGSVFAAGPSDNAAQSQTQTQTQNQGEECICGECNKVVNNYSYQYANSGAPQAGYKYAHQNGKIVE